MQTQHARGTILALWLHSPKLSTKRKKNDVDGAPQSLCTVHVTELITIIPYMVQILSVFPYAWRSLGALEFNYYIWTLNMAGCHLCILWHGLKIPSSLWCVDFKYNAISLIGMMCYLLGNSVHIDCRFRLQSSGWKSSVRFEPRRQLLFVLIYYNNVQNF